MLARLLAQALPVRQMPKSGTQPARCTGGGSATGGCSACRAAARIQPIKADAIMANPVAANPAPIPMERQRAASRVGRWPAVWCNVWKTARPEWRATL